MLTDKHLALIEKQLDRLYAQLDLALPEEDDYWWILANIEKLHGAIAPPQETDFQVSLKPEGLQ